MSEQRSVRNALDNSGQPSATRSARHVVRRPSDGGEKKEATRCASGGDCVRCHLREAPLHAGSRATATEL